MIAVADLNGLKHLNDTHGHPAGDLAIAVVSSEFADKIDGGLKAYNDSHSNPFTVGASYGWVLLPPKEGMTDLDEYIGIADSRMYEMRVERDKYRRE